MERKVHLVNKRPPKPKLLKVAAYARVSSDKDAQIHSLAAQVDYYQKLIRNTPGWQYCGVFADEAFTGTKDSRDAFQQMLEKCRNHEIDMIITKSISRFARNTVTLLETVRELKLLGIDVYFEKENLHSSTGDGELMISILASFAQEESKSASDNRKWQIRKDFQQGKIGSITILGYRRNADGQLEIEPDEAEIVRMIFNDYISGMGGQQISNKLNEMGIKTRQGNLWTSPRIKEIIQNEKYIGNLLLHKYYRNNHIEKKKTKNHGELQQILVEEAHEPIIDIETFKTAQQIVLDRQMKFSHEGALNRYPLSGMIKCGCCGKNYQRKIYPQGAAWLCSTYLRRGKKYCPESKQIREEILLKLIGDFAIKQIDVPEPNELIFTLADGTKIQKHWENPSRSVSRMADMREEARQNAKNHNNTPDN